MMQAAQLAAEAAMQEAAARDAAAAAAAASGNTGNRVDVAGSGGMNRAAFQAAEQHMMDLEASNASLTMDDDNNLQLEQQLGLLRALQAAEMGDHGGGVPPHILHEMNMLGMDPNDAESMQALFQMMAQQEQENARPDEHYLTIAQNGKKFSLEQ
jgi:hypothetical protein